MIRVSGPTASDANLAIINTATYKSYVNTAGAEDDDVLTDVIIPALCREFYEDTGGRFITDISAHTYIMERYGSVWNRLKLPQAPIVTITSVELGELTGGVFATDFIVSETLTSADYYFEPGSDTLVNLKKSWPIRENSVRVVFEAGEPVPATLTRAMAEWVGVVNKHASNADWDIRAQTKGSESKALADTERPEAIRAQIRKYAIVGYGLG